MKRTIASLAAAILLLCTTAQPAYATSENPDSITREYAFVSQTDDFFYDAPSQVSENGRVYFRQDVRYEVLGQEPLFKTEEKTFTHEELLTGLSRQSEDKFSEEYAIDEDGYQGSVPRKAVTWTERTKQGPARQYAAEVDLGDQVDVPVPLKEREVVYRDAASNADAIAVFPLKDVKMTAPFRWLPNHTATLVVRVGDIMSIDEASPAWQGKEAQLLALMRLDPQKYIIRAAAWSGSALDGTRTVVFTMDRYAAHFVAIYEGKVQGQDAVTYDGTARYEGVLTKDVPDGVEYAVKAIVTYQAPVSATPTPTPTPAPTSMPEPTPDPAPPTSALPIAAMVAVPLAIGAAVFVFFWRRKQKSDEN